MDRVFGTYGRQKKCRKCFGGESEGKRPLNVLGVDGKKNIKINIHVIVWRCKEWPILIWLRIGAG
jgi:hypothetical protein